MSPSIGAGNNTSNYLVPAGGATHAIPVQGVFGGVPEIIDWRQYSVDNFPFQPQGAFVDNSQGAGPLVIEILTSANGVVFWTVTVPAGAVQAISFPAPDGQATSITGDGQATIIFVDFPVLPSGTDVTVSNTVNVDIVSPNPVPTAPSVNSGGIPYQNTEVPAVVTPFFNNAITGASTSSGNITPSANTFLRKLVLTLTGNTTLAAAGLNLITATLNGTVIFKENVYIPAAATDAAEFWTRDLDFSKLGLNAGAGSLVVTVGTALATGELDINAYFG
ncbi:MAG: hypothetical protein ACP5QA_10425 [Phycisphaerae bacterium]